MGFEFGAAARVAATGAGAVTAFGRASSRTRPTRRMPRTRLTATM